MGEGLHDWRVDCCFCVYVIYKPLFITNSAELVYDILLAGWCSGHSGVLYLISIGCFFVGHYWFITDQRIDTALSIRDILT